MQPTDGPSVNSFDGILRDLSKQTGCAVVFPSYTLAPEARFPTQQEECYAVVKWVREHGRTKGLRQDGFAIVGDSAGGPSFSLYSTTSYETDVHRPTYRRDKHPLLHAQTTHTHRAPNTPASYSQH